MYAVVVKGGTYSFAKNDSEKGPVIRIPYLQMNVAVSHHNTHLCLITQQGCATLQ